MRKENKTDSAVAFDILGRNGKHFTAPVQQRELKKKKKELRKKRSSKSFSFITFSANFPTVFA